MRQVNFIYCLVAILSVGYLLAAQGTWEVYTGGTAPGSTTMPNIKTALEALQTTNAGATEPTYKTTGTPWYDTTTDKLKWYDGSAWITQWSVTEASDSAVPHSRGVALDVLHTAFTDQDATPSVSGAVSFSTANTVMTTYTDFDDGVQGQWLMLLCTDVYTTIDGGLTKTGMTIPLIAGDTLWWIYDGSAWRQVAGSVGMGRFVPLSDAASISSWIAVTQTSPTGIDLGASGDDLIREGANAVVIKTIYGAVNTPAAVYSRPNGSSDTGLGAYKHYMPVGGAQNSQEYTVGLDSDGIFEAWLGNSAVSATTFEAHVIGYYI
jgi:hypothetical protein